MSLSVAHSLVIWQSLQTGSGKEYGLSDKSSGEGGQLYGAGKDHRGVKVPTCTNIIVESLPRWWISLRRPSKTWMFTQVWWKGPWQEPQLQLLPPARWGLSQTRSSILESLFIQVDDLIKQVAEENGLEVAGQLASVGVPSTALGEATASTVTDTLLKTN